MRADERKKVENKESRRNYTEQAKPTETLEKPTEIGVALLFRYSVSSSKGWFQEDFEALKYTYKRRKWNFGIFKNCMSQAVEISVCSERGNLLYIK